MKRIALYLRVSSPSQNCEMQRLDLQKFAAERGYTIVCEYSDVASGAEAKRKRPGLQKLLSDVCRSSRPFDGVAVWSGDRMARSVRDFLEILDLLSQNNVEYISLREGFTSEGPLGRAFTILIGMISEVERGILISRIKSGMARARLVDGVKIGRPALNIDRRQVVRDRLSGMSITLVAKKHGISRASVCRLVNENRGGSQGVDNRNLQAVDSMKSELAA